MTIKKRERSEEEVASEFANASTVVNTDRAAADDEREIQELEEQIRKNEEMEAERAQLLASKPSNPIGGLPVTEIAEAIKSIDPSTLSPMEKIMFMMADALAKVAAGQANAQVVAAKALDDAARQQQPDNRFAPMISELNPQGDLQHPRPKLKCPMFLPWEADWDSLSFEEIELLNLLEQGEYVIKTIDNRRVEVKVQIKMNYNGKPDRLLMNSEAAFNEENGWKMPALTSVLRQIAAHRPHTKLAASKVLSMDDRIEQVLSGQLPVSVGTR